LSGSASRLLPTSTKPSTPTTSATMRTLDMLPWHLCVYVCVCGSARVSMRGWSSMRNELMWEEVCGLLFVPW
jgi:hypothetical protein